MYVDYLLLLFILLTAMFYSVKKNKLTFNAAMTGGVIGICIFLGAGFTGIAMIGLFFLLGTKATSWKISTKENLGTAEQNKGRRTAGQVVANGGVAALSGVASWLFAGQSGLFQLMMAAALASATADTLSSELGTLYGKKFYNILSLQKDTRGENGVVSIEGTLIGVAGSMLIAVVYASGFEWNRRFAWVVVAGTVGNITDSILGATLERKHLLKNDQVNFLNTFVAALAAFFLSAIF